MQRGYIRLWRKMQDSGLLQHPTALQIFTWCLLNCAWRHTKYATRYGVINLKPGEIIVGRKKLAATLESTEQKIRTALTLLSTMKILTIESTNEFSRITLINWGKYQNSPEEITNPQPTANQQLTTVKELKNEEFKEQPYTADAVAENQALDLGADLKPVKPDSRRAKKDKTPERLALEAASRLMRDYWFAEYKKLPGRSSGATFQPWKTIFDAECRAISQHGLEEMKRRARNCLHSGYNPNPTYQKYIMDPDKWVELMEKRVQGPRGEYDRKERTNAVPDIVAQMAKSWGLK